MDQVRSGPAVCGEESVGEVFGVELMDGLLEDVAVGKVDTAVGECGDDLYGGAPEVSSSKASPKSGR